MRESRSVGGLPSVGICSLALITRAYGFGQEGHEAVAILVLKKLHADQAQNNPKGKLALTHITRILGNEDMAAVAVYADWIRLKEINHLSLCEIKDIDARFPGNGTWHLVYLTLGTKAYSETEVSAGT